MKRVILRNWMAAALLLGACCGLVACDDDNDGPTEPDVTAVEGEYQGEMTILKVAPTDDNEQQPAGTAVSATVSAGKILFENFPVRDLIVEVVGEEMADQLMAQIGQVDYAVPYTALMSDDKAEVKLTLQPETLKLTLSDDSGNEGEDGAGETSEDGSEDGSGTEIEVTITAEAEGTYTLASKELSFTLAATAVKMAGQEVPFEAMNIAFELVKK